LDLVVNFLQVFIREVGLSIYYRLIQEWDAAGEVFHLLSIILGHSAATPLGIFMYVAGDCDVLAK
jgi:hypothetical protein